MPLFTTTRRRNSSRRRRAAPARRRRTASSSLFSNPPKRRRTARRRARRNYWPNNHQGHVKAARLGWTRRKTRKVTRKAVRKTSRRRKARKNPMRSYRRSARRRNPVMRYRRRSARRSRRNPLNLRSFTSKSTLMTAATIGIGIVAGYMVLPAVCKVLPASWSGPIASATGWGKARGLINVAVGIAMYSMRNKRIKTIGMVIAGTGIYDLIAVNTQEYLHLPQLPSSNPLLGGGPVSGGYLPMPIRSTASAGSVAGSYGQGSYGMGTSYDMQGASYESPNLKAFGDDFDL